MSEQLPLFETDVVDHRICPLCGQLVNIYNSKGKSGDPALNYYGEHPLKEPGDGWCGAGWNPISSFEDKS